MSIQYEFLLEVENSENPKVYIQRLKGNYLTYFSKLEVPIKIKKEENTGYELDFQNSHIENGERLAYEKRFGQKRILKRLEQESEEIIKKALKGEKLTRNQRKIKFKIRDKELELKTRYGNTKRVKIARGRGKVLE